MDSRPASEMSIQDDDSCMINEESEVFQRVQVAFDQALESYIHEQMHIIMHIIGSRIDSTNSCVDWSLDPSKYGI